MELQASRKQIKSYRCKLQQSVNVRSVIMHYTLTLVHCPPDMNGEAIYKQRRTVNTWRVDHRRYSENFDRWEDSRADCFDGLGVFGELYQQACRECKAYNCVITPLTSPQWTGPTAQALVWTWKFSASPLQSPTLVNHQFGPFNNVMACCARTWAQRVLSHVTRHLFVTL